MSARLVVMESVVEAPTFCYRCDRERDRNTIEGLYEPWLKTGDGIVCPSCLLPRERIFVDAQINGSVGALLAEEARREEWQLDEPDRLFRDNGAGYPSRRDRVCARTGRRGDA